MNIKELIKQPESRRLEFKGELPENADLAKSIIAFANDAGGCLYIGVSNDPRDVIGIAEDELMATEEKISSIIYDRCYPAILPEITFLTENDKHLIKVSVYRGSTPPYYLKDKGKMQGTYIRVGSTNRKADETIIAELERIRRNISFDSEIIVEKPVDQLNIDNFAATFIEKAGETINAQVLKKLDLTKELNGVTYPTNALVLFSDDELRDSQFHFAKVECARFKGIVTDEFIDQKSITTNIATQAEEAYNFVLRHINKGATVEGVYTVSKWEYPVKAVREAIRNAVVHRDYSLTGKDVKVAVYDDMIEITSPGLLPPSIDYSAMESRQSDARNKVIAPVFKRLGIIDQWGNGLRLIANELKDYPQIDFRWKEVGLSFQVQFIKLDYVTEQVLDNTPKPTDGTIKPADGTIKPADGTIKPADGTIKPADGTINSETIIKKMIFKLILEKEGISARDITKLIGKSLRTTMRYIDMLKKENKIEFRGSLKNGGYYIKQK